MTVTHVRAHGGHDPLQSDGWRGRYSLHPPPPGDAREYLTSLSLLPYLFSGEERLTCLCLYIGYGITHHSLYPTGLAAQ